MQVHFALAQLYAYQGNMDSAIEQYQASYRIASCDVPSAVPQVEEALGIIYPHKSEMENNAYHASGENVSFPCVLEVAIVRNKCPR
jgi:hypothetical protein